MSTFTEIPARIVVGKRAIVGHEAMSDFFAQAYEATAAFLGERQLVPVVCGGYYFSGPPQFDLLAGFEIDASGLADEGLQALREAAQALGLTVHEFEPMEAVERVYEGTYDGLADEWLRLQDEVAAVDGAIERTVVTWEDYVSMPGEETPDAPYLTKLYWGLRTV